MLYSAIACNMDADLLQAALPLFAADKVEAIEWSFDTLYKQAQLPDWFDELLQTYGHAGRLVGHGVFFSLFSGKWTPEQSQWLSQLKEMAATYRFDHITEHFGFMTGNDFHKGAPLSVPFTASTLALGRDRLKRIQQAGNCPVGLENLAFAYSLEEVQRQGTFLNQLIEPVNGFIILDLHNVYCQLHNFDVDPASLLAAYPLDRVREIHISGGSWTTSVHEPTRQIRRDTHDDAVPDSVLHLLEQTIPACPNLKFVVLEQLGTALRTKENQAQFQLNFAQMDAIAQTANRQNRSAGSACFLPSPFRLDTPPLEDVLLHTQQTELSTILETALTPQHARTLLQKSTLANSEWAIEAWDPYMLETALAIAQKWQHGFA